MDNINKQLTNNNNNYYPEAICTLQHICKIYKAKAGKI